MISSTLCLLLLACGDPVEVEVEHVDLQLIGDRGDEADVAAIARELELRPNRDYTDSMDLGTCYLWQGEYFRAAELYEVAARQASDADLLAAALYAKATAAAYAGHIEPALDAADALVRLKPRSEEAAWLRLGLYLHSSDRLGTLAARDHVMRLDPDASGHEVFLDPTTAAIVGGVIVVAIVAETSVRMLQLVPPEDRKEVVVPMFKAVAAVGGAAIQGPISAAAGVTDLGHKLVLDRS